MYSFFLILIVIFFGPHNFTWAKTTEAVEVKIEAAGNVDYDMDNHSAVASKDVILTKGDIIIECQDLIYNGKTGDVQASGDVKISTGKFTYQTETLNYNLNQEIGDLAEFKGKIKGETRDYFLTGSNGALAGETGIISKATMNRCLQPKPEYVLKANRINFDSERVYLHGVVLKVKGVPVFYFPKLSFKTDDNDLPDISIKYDQEDGFQVHFDYAGPIKDNRVWLYTGDFSTKGSNIAGLGLKQYYGKQVTNTTNLIYDFDGFWQLNNGFNYGAPLYNLYLDGMREFSDAEETQLGIRLTSKYWQAPIGRWRFGVLARHVYALDYSNHEYGGTYWGGQLDYNPSRYLGLSYLWLGSEETNEDYREFLEDFKLGNNYLYNISIPLTEKYSLGLDGTYNTDVDDNWIHRFYRLKYETCCLRFLTGWNDLDKTWEFNARIKF